MGTRAAAAKQVKSAQKSPAARAVLPDESLVPLVVRMIQQYKTKQGINNALMKELKDAKRAGEIYQAIKPLISNKK